MFNLIFIFPIVIAYLMDMLFGDPENLWHPIRSIGALISFLEKLFRAVFPESPIGEMIAGAVLVFFTLLTSVAIPFVIIVCAYRLNLFFGLIADAVLCYYLLSVKSLKSESMKVYEPLKNGDIAKARWFLSRIVGRDTENLSEEGISKAAVETVAENTADGAIAPMIYMSIGGAPLGYFYKAINTMDSMIAYKNDRYIFFGKIAARLDDIANFIPARIAAFLMIAASFLLGYDYKNAIKIFCRDRYKHASPNSAQTEAVCAGALNIRLAGDAHYFGKLYKKEYIGDELRPVQKDDIVRANRLLYTASALSLIFCILIRMLIVWLI
ncbi:MAG: adenosylcobinamide-phosphate synthase CbiB [Eubacteriales bacterium]